jgi:hypothetical protein
VPGTFCLFKLLEPDAQRWGQIPVIS